MVIPNTWKWVTLGDIAVTSSGGTPNRKNSNYFKGNIPWVKSGELNYNTITETQEYITEEALAFSSAKIFPKGSLLIALYGNTVGRMAFLGIDASTNQAVASITSFLINPKYLYYYLMSSKEDLLNKREGSAQPNISQRVLNEYLFPLAPLEEQDKIVNKIDELFSQLDKITEELDNCSKLIEIQKKNIISKALKAIPKNNYVEIEKISTKITDGTHHTPKYIDHGVHFISVKDINNGEINFSNTKFISEDEHEKLIKRCNPEYGDVLITKSGTIGRVAIVPEMPRFSLFVSVALIKIDKERIHSKFLIYCLENFINSINIKDDIKGAVQKNFHLEDIRVTKIPFCEITDQLRIVNNIEYQLNNLNDLKTAIEDSSLQNKHLYNKILKEAFEGKLFPQNTRDTSIEILLAQIIEYKEKYISRQVENKRNKPKYIKMKKEKLNIIEVLEIHNEPINAHDLWQESKHENIDEFYEKLKEIAHLIKQDVSDKIVKISLK